MIKEKLKQLILDALHEISIDYSLEQIELTHPTNPRHGDYASNVAFMLFEREKSTTPHELAEEIVSRIKLEIEEVEKVQEVDGFINFQLSDGFFIQQMNEALAKKEKYGKPEHIKKLKIMIEFGQPNTHKLPHIGHFRSYVLGESLARLLEFSGFEVFRANYQGDVGLHVAKCLWGLKKLKTQNSKLTAETLNDKMGRKFTLEEKVQLLQETYVAGNKAYEGNPQAKRGIDQLNIKIYQKNPSIFDLWQETRLWSLDYYEDLNRRLSVKYDRLYFESEAADFGKKIVLENLGKVFKQSKGAIIFEGSKFSLHNRVFITSTGNPTYEAKDLGLIFLKTEDFKYDLSLISTASEQTEYFKVVYQAASLIDKRLAEKFKHIPFGLVSLTGGKLSSREGQIVSIDELLGSVKETLVGVMRKKNYPQNRIDKVVGPLIAGAAKYSLLKQIAIKDITFDIQESVSIEGNSGPYLQYTYARAKSILRKAGKKPSFKGPSFADYQETILGKSEKDVLRLLCQFPEVVEQASKDYAPNLVCNYLFDLAQSFNQFYEKERVIGDEREEFRLCAVTAVAYILRNGLWLLGIEAPERM